MQYLAYLHKEDNSDYGVSFPDFPGCVTAGKNIAEARKMATEALGIHIRGMLTDRETIPRPSPLDCSALKASGAIAFHVDLGEFNEVIEKSWQSSGSGTGEYKGCC